MFEDSIFSITKEDEIRASKAWQKENPHFVGPVRVNRVKRFLSEKEARTAVWLDYALTRQPCVMLGDAQHTVAYLMVG